MNIDENANVATLPRAEAIAQLNDTLRKTGEGGTIVVTQGALAIDGFDRSALVGALASFDRFDADNDPHGERDFGNFRLFQTDLYFKVDYYNLDLNFGSDDPADASVTHRVLTIMTEADL